MQSLYTTNRMNEKDKVADVLLFPIFKVNNYFI